MPVPVAGVRGLGGNAASSCAFGKFNGKRRLYGFLNFHTVSLIAGARGGGTC